MPLVAISNYQPLPILSFTIPPYAPLDRVWASRMVEGCSRVGNADPLDPETSIRKELLVKMAPRIFRKRHTFGQNRLRD